MNFLRYGGLVAAVLGGLPALCGTVELVTNGNFASGNVGFSTDYTFVADSFSVSSTGNCFPAPGLFTIGSDPSSCHSLWSSFSPFDATGAMMIVNGAASPATVWSETVSVVPGSTYTFSAHVASNFPTSPAILDFSVNGTQLGTNFAVNATPGTWSQFSGNWNSGASTTALLTIVDLNLAAQGNDFSLDDISFQPAAVPEPSSMALIMGALFVLLLVRIYSPNFPAFSRKKFPSRI